MTKKHEQLNTFEQSRYFETREYEMTEDEIRSNIDTIHSDPFYIDPSIIPEGMVYGWKREFYQKAGGEEDKFRIPESLGKGWTVVPAERHPHLRSFSASGHAKGYIERGGQILFERRKDFHKRELDNLDRHAHQQVHSHEALRGNAPFVNINQNSVSFGPPGY